MSLDTESQAFWEPSDVEGELKRVFDICNGCRRCYNLCPSFNDLTSAWIEKRLTAKRKS